MYKRQLFSYYGEWREKANLFSTMAETIWQSINNVFGNTFYCAFGQICDSPLAVSYTHLMTEITIVYGQTEASPGCTQSRADDPMDVRVNTVGRNLPGIECKIVSPETGEDLPDNVDGEFVARGYNIMKGYYKMPAATAAVIDEDGWLPVSYTHLKLQNGIQEITVRVSIFTKLSYFNNSLICPSVIQRWLGSSGTSVFSSSKMIILRFLLR